MVDKKTKEWSGCPVRFGMSQFGDKWSFLILRDLMFKGKHYYQEFLEAGEGISTNILASRLADLESNGLISKQRDAVKRSKFVYTLTDKGIDLLPMMLAMIDCPKNTMQKPKSLLISFASCAETPSRYIKSYDKAWLKNPKRSKGNIPVALRDKISSVIKMSVNPQNA
jgi:DNA-binding HxlR family transcriptional regulator